MTLSPTERLILAADLLDPLEEGVAVANALRDVARIMAEFQTPFVQTLAFADYVIAGGEPTP